MTSTLDYRGYSGSMDYNGTDEVFHGRIEFTRDLVTYEGADAKSLEQAFQDAVEDYLALLAQGRGDHDRENT